MKRFTFLFALALIFTGCMKEYDDASPIPALKSAPYLKVTGANMSGDTAYAAPNVFLSFGLTPCRRQWRITPSPGT